MFYEEYKNTVVTVTIPWFGSTPMTKYLESIAGPSVMKENKKQDKKVHTPTVKRLEFLFHNAGYANNFVATLKKMFKEDYLEVFTSEVPAYNDDWELFEEKARNHDWYYAMSDDHRVWSAGESAYKRLTAMLHYLRGIDEKRATEIYNKYCPLGK